MPHRYLLEEMLYLKHIKEKMNCVLKQESQFKLHCIRILLTLETYFSILYFAYYNLCKQTKEH